MEARQIPLSAKEKEVLSRVKKIHAQSVLGTTEKQKYKQENDVLYSFHAMEVECIGKGKLHKPYEFGNKVSVAVSGRGNFVLCAKSFHGNPYDVHTLLQTIESVEKLRSAEKKMIKRRSAIEPIIGHLKNFGRMAKNYLKGVIGDILNPLISAIGLNLRNLANNLTYKTKSIFL